MIAAKVIDHDRVDMLLRYVSVLDSVRVLNHVNLTGSTPINESIHKACDAIESLLLDDDVIPSLVNGGFVSKTTMVMVGDHLREMIVPLTDADFSKLPQNMDIIEK